jgi:imidazolonepropionase-like amidohydrolase
MKTDFIVRAETIVTVSDLGTIQNGAMMIGNGKIRAVAPWDAIQPAAADVPVIDCGKRVITPSLVDCHTHLTEFAPAALYPVTRHSHGLAAKATLLQALNSGITGLGEQICGFHRYDLDLAQFREWVRDVPIDVCFSLSAMTIGFDHPVHFSAATKSRPIPRDKLTDEEVLEFLAGHSEYPGENLFINATPANFAEPVVPNAGKIMYSQEELERIVKFYHGKGKRVGAHVGGETAIGAALKAGIDVLHHAHGITDDLIAKAAEQKTAVVATPTGGTHEAPNTPEEIAKLARAGLTVAISTDAYLPPHPQSRLPAEWRGRSLLGPEALMAAAHLAMRLLADDGWNENDILALITANAAEILGKKEQFGSLKPGLDANFLVARGIPGLEITDPGEIEQVYYRGAKVIDRKTASAP